MKDELMNSSRRKDVPILIIVICAGFSMIVDTISSSIKIMGYDEVIQADAKARASKILQEANNSKEYKDSLNLLQEQFDSLKLDMEILKEDNEHLKLLSHKSGK